VIVANFAHPLTAEQLGQIEALAGESVERVIEVPCQVDNGAPLGKQVQALADACGLSGQEWQQAALLVVPPSLNFVAVALLAELHGRCGYFPAHVRLAPVEGSLPRRFTVVELLDLQGQREAARERAQRPSH